MGLLRGVNPIESLPHAGYRPAFRVTARERGTGCGKGFNAPPVLYGWGGVWFPRFLGRHGVSRDGVDEVRRVGSTSST